MGKGTAVIPTKGQIVAPFDGVIEVFFKTKHALALRSNDGVEMLIHVGIDTVNLNGKYFTDKKSQGDKIKTGDVLLEFDIEGIRSEGYNVVTPVIVTNSDNYLDVVECDKDRININENILTLI